MYGTIDTELAWGIFPGSNTSMFSDQKRASVSFARLTVSRVPILSDVLKQLHVSATVQQKSLSA